MPLSKVVLLLCLVCAPLSCMQPQPLFPPRPTAERGANLILILTEDEPPMAFELLTSVLEEGGYRIVAIDVMSSSLTARRELERGDDLTLKAVVRRTDRTEVAMRGEIQRGLDGVPRRLVDTGRADDGFSQIRLLAERYPNADLLFARTN